ncbi:MarR family transcriptional regulator [Streptomyces sp. NPDC000133]|uniref:MarR family transcriptional regulator n=2 Tax=unclassified Streptomyces TaxID=2593676 RepID=UPI0036B8836D
MASSSQSYGNAPSTRTAPKARSGLRPAQCAFTSVLMASGLTRMAARVLTRLFTTDAGSPTASRLARRLQVSRASVSKAIAYLESQSLVRGERHERRRDRYVVDDELFHQA